MKRKPKPNEPSLRERLSQKFLEALEADFKIYRANVLERMRETHPERYAELAGKLIMTSEPRPDGFEAEVGLDAPTDDQIAEAIKANDRLIVQLEAIRDKAQGGLN
jgi:hypothetical protein